jgi:hypothetical protein
MSVNRETSEAIDYLKQRFGELLTGTEVCVRAKLFSPALVLVYSGIDVAGWLYASDPTTRTGPRFTKWVTQYLLPAGPELEVSAQELYGARCGLLHNFSSESHLSRQGKVRQIQYTWGSKSAETLIEITKIVNMDKQHTVIKVEELIAAFRAGLSRFFEDAAADPQIGERLVMRSGKVIGQMSKAHVEELLRFRKELLGDG